MTVGDMSMYSGCIVKFGEIDENNEDGGNYGKGVISYTTRNYA
jgi:hypothetical protein